MSGKDKQVTHAECVAPVTLFRSSMSDGTWKYVCHKFGIHVDSEKVRSITIASCDISVNDRLDVSYEWAP